jgi:hypothetical protein
LIGGEEKPPQISKVETATHGSKFVAARAAAEQVVDLRTTLAEFAPEFAFGSSMGEVGVEQLHLSA